VFVRTLCPIDDCITISIRFIQVHNCCWNGHLGGLKDHDGSKIIPGAGIGEPVAARAIKFYISIFTTYISILSF
jgi:hypothetical protein